MPGELKVSRIMYTVAGKEYTATPATADEIKQAGLSETCSCGQEQCRGGWVWRCMAGGGGQCVWYRTNEVC
jgi:hypothetical protein